MKISSHLSPCIMAAAFVFGMSSAQAVTISFEDDNPGAGTITYDGIGGALLGANIGFNQISVDGTPTTDCPGCTINFASGPLIGQSGNVAADGFPPQYEFNWADNLDNPFNGYDFVICGTTLDVEGFCSDVLALGQVGSAQATLTDNAVGADDLVISTTVLGLAIIDEALQSALGVGPIPGEVWFGQGGTNARADFIEETDGGLSFASFDGIADVDWHLTAATTEVPEPVTLGLFGLGLLGLGAVRAYRKSA